MQAKRSNSNRLKPITDDCPGCSDTFCADCLVRDVLLRIQADPCAHDSSKWRVDEN